MFTSGFYNSVNSDRTYNAVLMDQIFDGVIADGVFATFGSSLLVSENALMNVQVADGRAWFDHSWSYNDSPLVVAIRQSDLILNRIDAVVLEMDSSEEGRENSIKVVSGIPAGSPVNPDMIKTATVNQYP